MPSGFQQFLSQYHYMGPKRPGDALAHLEGPEAYVEALKLYQHQMNIPMTGTVAFISQ